jgi:hypothetical protein
VRRAFYFWFAAWGGLACSSPARAPALGDDLPRDEGGAGSTGGAGGGRCIDDAATPPPPDAQGFCGNTFLKATSDPPNVYFVIDRSGSMLETVDGRVKYDAVASASVGLVRRLGSQVNVGAAVFPGPLVNADDGCVPGDEVFPTRPGDAIGSGACDPDGPVTRGFSFSISLASGSVPLGGTPTAATLVRLLPTLSALPGRTAVILATDGGPNCNPSAVCDESKCIPNIEHSPPCTDGLNCCLPSLYGPTSCLDDVATLAALGELSRRGIKTYVVGIPGTAPYAALLGDMAHVGGTARPAGSGAAYYDVDHLNELDGILAAIGSTVVLSCHLHLEMAPKAMSLVNVYLDRQLVPYGGPDGWVWTNPGDAGPGDAGPAGVSDAPDDSATNDDAPGFDGAPPTTDDDASAGLDAAPPRQDLDLLGGSCDLLNSGKVRQVQVVFGCPTVTPK